MSAECHVCGHDLPYDLECQYCALRARAERAEERTRVLEEALRVASQDKWAQMGTRRIARAALRVSAPTEQGGTE